jgi:hypothetical protein
MDQDLALAFERHVAVTEAARCPSCGTEPSEWVDGQGRRLLEPAWMPEVVGCPGCDTIDATRSQIPEADRQHRRVRLRRARASDFIDLDD